MPVAVLAARSSRVGSNVSPEALKSTPSARSRATLPTAASGVKTASQSQARLFLGAVSFMDFGVELLPFYEMASSKSPLVLSALCSSTRFGKREPPRGSYAPRARATEFESLATSACATASKSRGCRNTF